MQSPTERTLNWLRKIGAHAAVVEKFNPHVGQWGKTFDMWGWIDLVGCHSAHGIFAVQVTSGSHVAERIKKLNSDEVKPENREALKAWMAPGCGTLWAFGWRQLQSGGGKYWQPKIVGISYNAEKDVFEGTPMHFLGRYVEGEVLVRVMGPRKPRKPKMRLSQMSVPTSAELF